MKKYLYQYAYFVRKLYWLVVRPRTHGVKVIVEKDGKLLLIRNTYGKRRWTFVGGGIKRGETPLKAAIRETHEEVGLVIRPVALGTFQLTSRFRRDYVNVYYAQADSGKLKLSAAEVSAAKWFRPSRIPTETSETAAKVLELYFKHQKHKHFNK